MEYWSREKSVISYQLSVIRNPPKADLKLITDYSALGGLPITIFSSLHHSIILGLLFLLFIFGCASKSSIRLDPENEFKRAELNYKRRKYDKAIEGFKRVMFEHPGSKWVEYAQFLLAKSYFEKKDYTQAELEYEFFIKTYPRSRFTPTASFDLASSCFKQTSPYYLDQSLTLRALEKFRVFIQEYPNSKLVGQAEEYKMKCIDRLVRKELETAKLYVKMGKGKAAKLYLESVLQSYPDNSYLEEIDNLLEEIGNSK